MNIIAEIRSSLADDWLPTIYESKVRSQRTRSINIDVPVRENLAEIQYTLLGIEFKVGKRRFSCPDLPTARFMRVFARIGVRDFAIPYDITKISVVADELEASWQRSCIFVSRLTRKESDRMKTRWRNLLAKSIRTQIAEIGAGDAMPEFNRVTIQRDT